MPIESPCTKVCVIEPASGLCIGCGRTGEEIGGWLGYSASERRALMALLPSRLETPPVSEGERTVPSFAPLRAEQA